MLENDVLRALYVAAGSARPPPAGRWWPARSAAVYETAGSRRKVQSGQRRGPGRRSAARCAGCVRRLGIRRRPVEPVVIYRHSSRRARARATSSGRHGGVGHLQQCPQGGTLADAAESARHARENAENGLSAALAMVNRVAALIAQPWKPASAARRDAFARHPLGTTAGTFCGSAVLHRLPFSPRDMLAAIQGASARVVHRG